MLNHERLLSVPLRECSWGDREDGKSERGRVSVGWRKKGRKKSKDMVSGDPKAYPQV